jgi:hypothetical protein
MLASKLLLSALLLAGSSAFAPSQIQKYSAQTNKNADSIITNYMSSQDNAQEEDNSSRRGFIQKIVGGVALAGIVGNGIAVQGPSPFAPPVDSLQNKLIVITGGNTGLGLESGKRLAAAGATVVLTSRNLEKGLRAVQSVKDYVSEETGRINDNVYTLPLDLCDLESVKAFPALLKNSDAFKSTQKIDVLLK